MAPSRASASAYESSGTPGSEQLYALLLENGILRSDRAVKSREARPARTTTAPDYTGLNPPLPELQFARAHRRAGLERFTPAKGDPCRAAPTAARREASLREGLGWSRLPADRFMQFIGFDVRCTEAGLLRPHPSYAVDTTLRAAPAHHPTPRHTAGGGEAPREASRAGGGGGGGGDGFRRPASPAMGGSSDGSADSTDPVQPTGCGGGGGGGGGGACLDSVLTQPLGGGVLRCPGGPGQGVVPRVAAHCGSLSCGRSSPPGLLGEDVCISPKRSVASSTRACSLQLSDLPVGAFRRDSRASTPRSF